MNWSHLLGNMRAASEMNPWDLCTVLNEICCLFSFCAFFMFTRCCFELPIFVVGGAQEIVDISYEANHENWTSIQDKEKERDEESMEVNHSRSQKTDHLYTFKDTTVSGETANVADGTCLIFLFIGSLRKALW
ncbi:uncharacterized [Tachysurus ichikawai]